MKNLSATLLPLVVWLAVHSGAEGYRYSYVFNHDTTAANNHHRHHHGKHHSPAEADSWDSGIWSSSGLRLAPVSIIARIHHLQRLALVFNGSVQPGRPTNTEELRQRGESGDELARMLEAYSHSPDDSLVPEVEVGKELLAKISAEMETKYVKPPAEAGRRRFDMLVGDVEENHRDLARFKTALEEKLEELKAQRPATSHHSHRHRQAAEKFATSVKEAKANAHLFLANVDTNNPARLINKLPLEQVTHMQRLLAKYAPPAGGDDDLELALAVGRDLLEEMVGLDAHSVQMSNDQAERYEEVVRSFGPREGPSFCLSMRQRLSRKLADLEKLKYEQNKESSFHSQHSHHHHHKQPQGAIDDQPDHELTPEQRVIRRIEDAAVFVKNVRVEGGNTFVDVAGLRMMGKGHWLDSINFNPRVQGESLLGELDRQITNIALNPNPETYYDLLNVPPTASEHAIRRSYRQLALLYHPDKNGGRESERFKRIGDAYSTLSDPRKKKYYDDTGRRTGVGADNTGLNTLQLVVAKVNGENFTADEAKKQLEVLVEQLRGAN